MRSFRVLPFFLILAACGDEAPPVSAPTTKTPATEPEKPQPEAPAPTPPAIAWEKCSLETGGVDGRAECANVEVPLDWNAPEGKKVTFFVKRVLGRANGPKQQLWLLQGGPGGAGDGLEPLAEEVIARDDTVDIYIPDHRGTGRSAFLDCPANRKSRAFDFADCAAEATKIWGADGLATFSTTTAAHDVGYVIERTKEKDQKVHVYGVSYGTYWAQRYLQLFPTQASAVTLDSVCQSTICSLSKMTYWFDSVAKKYLGECAQDAFCAEKMGPDPVAKVKQSIDIADKGTCSGIQGLDGNTLRMVYSWFITSVQMRVMIPSIAYRVVRCNDDDVEALQNFVYTLNQMFGGGAGGTRSGFATKDLSSDILGINIALSELEENPLPTAEKVATVLEGTLFGDAYEVQRWKEYMKWPRYARDQWVDKYPETATPILLMNGSLDPQTPQEFADQIAPHYKQPHQTYVLFPRAAHSVIHQSPMEDAAAEPCGTTVWKQFVANPTAPIDSSCTSKIRAHHFDEQPQVAQWMYGRPSLWSAAPKISAPSYPQAQGCPAPLAYATNKAFESELRRAERDTRLMHLGKRLLGHAR